MNILERVLPEPFRERLETTIAAALGLFLGLRYNDFVKKLMNRLLPNVHSLWSEFIILMGLTVLVVYITIYVRRALDGK